MATQQQVATDVCGIVLAGVHPWDRAALDAQLPRPLLPIVHMPLIGYALRWLHEGGVRNVTVCANSASRLVRACLGDGDLLGLDLRYYEDWTPRGPAGCLHDAGLDQPAQVYVITDGTIIPQVDLAALLAAHSNSGAAVTVAVDASPGSEEAEPGALQPVGIYAFARRALELIPVTGYQDIKEVLIPRLRERGERVLPYHTEIPCPRVTGFESYLRVTGWLLERLPAEPEWPGFVRRGEAQVHRNAQVADDALLLGPVLIGPDCVIEARATIVGPAACAGGCGVGAEAVVSRSLLWEGATVGPGAVLDQCVVAYDADVKAHAHLHNQYLTARRCPRRAADSHAKVLASAKDVL